MEDLKVKVLVKATGVTLDVIEISWCSKTVRCVVGGQYTNPSNGEMEFDYDFPEYTFDEIELVKGE